VKRPAFLATTAALFLALAVAGAVGARSTADTIRLTAALTAADEVPAPTGDVTAARGAFTVTATRSATGATLTWQLTFSGLTGPAAAAHIHTAGSVRRGQTAYGQAIVGRACTKVHRCPSTSSAV
jgi:Cu/Zn superoxide dismutase